MNNQNNISRKVYFADNKKVWEKANKNNDMYVFIRYDGEIDKFKMTKKNRTKAYFICGVFVSSIIILSYLSTYSLNEIFIGAEAVFSFLYQMAMAYLMSAFFYFITVIVPEKRRREKTRVIINNRLEQIAYDMSMVSTEIHNVEGIERNILNFNTQSSVIDRKTIKMGEKQYLSLGDYVIETTAKIREECKALLDMFYLDMPVETILAINYSLNTYVNRKEFSDFITDLGCFEIAGDDILGEYDNLIKKLKCNRIK